MAIINSVRKNKIRLVIADDYPSTRAGLILYLTRYPLSFEVLAETDNGIEAYHLCKEITPDILILDLHLPGADGSEVISKIREANLPVKILVLTGDNFVTAEELLRRGADAFLDKTASDETIVETLHKLSSQQIQKPSTSPALGPTPKHTLAITTPEKLFEKLTLREREVLYGLTKAYSNNTIAKELNIDTRTVGTHCTSIYAKLEVSSRTEAIVFALKNGFKPK